MDIKTLEQALKLQTDFTSRLKQSQDLQVKGKIPPVADLIKSKEQLVLRAQAEVETVINARDIAVNRWEERVLQSKANIAKLKSELDDLKGRLTERNGPPKTVKTDKQAGKSTAKKSGK